MPQRGAAGLRQILALDCLPPDTRLAFIHVGPRPRISWSGTLGMKGHALARFSDAWTPVETGSDPAGALELALEWLLDAQGGGRRLLTGWTDCIADPWKHDGQSHRFEAPEFLRWVGARAGRIEVCLFGVPPERQRLLRRTWSPLLASPPRLFEPAHDIVPEDLGLQGHRIF